MEREDPFVDTIKLINTKHRGAGVKPFGAEFLYEHKSGTTILNTARFTSSAFIDTTSDVAIDEVLELVLDNEQMNKTSLLNQGYEEINSGKEATSKHWVGQNRVRRRIEALIKTGAIVETQGYRREKMLHWKKDEKP